MWLIHAIYWCRRFYGYFHGFILSVLFNSRSDWWQNTQVCTVCCAPTPTTEGTKRICEQSISYCNNNNNDCWWWDLSELFNRHVFKFSRLFAYSANLIRNNILLIVQRSVKKNQCHAHILFNCKSFFCPQLLYFIESRNSQNDHEFIFYVHHC